MPEQVSGATQSVSKLDPSLRLQLLSLGRQIGNAHEADSAPGAVSVFVTFKGSVSSLERCNMTVNSYDGVVAMGAIPLTDLHRLEALEEVEWVSLAARVWPLIDRSIPEIKATDLRSNAPPYVSSAGPTAYTGKGVLVGIIDDRINLFHRSFMKPNPDKTIQVTRIVAIWDHYAIPDPAKGQGPPPGFTGGTFYDEATLNAILKSKDISALKMNSTYDHGSHVAGIAAGNGWIKDNQFAEFTFVGVAPEADIIFTNGAQLADTVVVANAVKFMFDFASERGQACVINMSFGTHEGARDGTSDLEKALDRLLIDAGGNPIPGRAVVAAMGNEADMSRHSRKNITANGKLTFTANMSPITFPSGAPLTQDSMNNIFFAWYDGAAALRFRLTAPGAIPDPAGWVNPGDVKDLMAGSVKIAHAASLATPDPRNGKKEIVFSIFPPAKFGDWKLEFEETSGNAAAIDIWVDRNGDIDIWPRFVPGDAVIDNTVTSPATAASVIAVGAYTSEPGSTVVSGEHHGEICKFSSWGLDAVFGVTKEQTRPALVAPGRRIISANFSSEVAKGVNYFLRRFDGWTLSQHVQYSGTSQAAPHVAGVIALMFQRNPTLTFKDIISIFEATASKTEIPAGLTFPNRTWGYGKLDARAAVLAVPAAP